MKIVVVGSGIFGVTGAVELARRGHAVTLLEAGAIPHPLAESTDVSKAVRMDYGADELYASEMERALDGWRAWNATWSEPLFHETGAMFVTRTAMAPGGFEHDSFETLTRRGHALLRLDALAIAERSSLAGFVDRYFNPQGGWAESTRVVTRLLADANVTVRPSAQVTHVVTSDARAVGVDVNGERIDADAVVVAAGSWTPALVPELAPFMKSTGQPVFHLAAPSDVRLPVFGADLARSGWYGFPRHRDGFVKVANHGLGVSVAEETSVREFLRASLPALADAAIVKTRICVYSDTLDEHFIIAPHPEIPNLVVATGGSGHGFKFAPRIGEWISRALEHDVIPRFRWRTDTRARGEEAARHRVG